MILGRNGRAGELHLPSDLESELEKEESFLSYCFVADRRENPGNSIVLQTQRNVPNSEIVPFCSLKRLFSCTNPYCRTFRW